MLPLDKLFISIQKESKEKHDWIFTYMYMVEQTNKNKKARKTQCRSDLTEQLACHCCKDINGSRVKLWSRNTDSSGFVFVLSPSSFE